MEATPVATFRVHEYLRPKVRMPICTFLSSCYDLHPRLFSRISLTSYFVNYVTNSLELFLLAAL
jgi:hypothetical protein